MEAHKRSTQPMGAVQIKGHATLQQVIENLTNAISKIPWHQHPTVA
jgi:hypothetical protein